MPKIIIQEDDLTQATGTVPSDVVFIPGFAGCTVTEASGNTLRQVKTDKCGTPLLVSSISEFEDAFGNGPFMLAVDKPDKSYLMAIELLRAGLAVCYCAFDPTTIPAATAGTIDADMLISKLYEAIPEYLAELEDRNEYTIKYITTGGYANYELDTTSSLATKMLACAEKRGDCVALIEPKDDPNQKLAGTDATSVCYKVRNDNIFTANGSFGAMFMPWCNYNLTGSDIEGAISLPGCFGYLLTLADTIKTSPNYYAIAGINRGIVPNVSNQNLKNRLSNTIADSHQPTTSSEGSRAINPITDIKPYGLTIWGNRTLATIGENGLKASNFLNVRNMVSDIKKVAYRAAKSLMFEQNNETLWVNFRGMVSPLLEQLKAGGGISNYKLLKLPTKYAGGTLGKEEFACAIVIIPVYPVESFEITVVMTDSDVTIGE